MKAQADGSISEEAARLLEILALEPIELNLFRGANEDRLGRLFGGQVLAQALRAASSTVDGRRPHSLHGYFMRAGDPERPVLYEVERIRDGSSFTTRRVVAVQNGEAIFNMDASFQIDEPGLSHEIAMPNVPRPDALEEDVTRARREAKTNPQISVWAQHPRPFETRSVFPQDQPRAPREQFWNPVWVRFRAAVPERRRGTYASVCSPTPPTWAWCPPRRCRTSTQYRAPKSRWRASTTRSGSIATSASTTGSSSSNAPAPPAAPAA